MVVSKGREAVKAKKAARLAQRSKGFGGILLKGKRVWTRLDDWAIYFMATRLAAAWHGQHMMAAN